MNVRKHARCVVGGLLWGLVWGWLLPSAPPAALNSQQPMYASPLSFEHITHEDGLLNERVQAIVQDQQGFLWFGTRDGLFRYDGYDLKRYQHDAQTPGSVPENSVTALHVDRHGVFWIGTQSRGLWCFDRDAEHFRPAPGNPALDIATAIYAITEDRQGVLWIGTSGQGVYRLNPDSGAWENDRHDPANPSSVSNDGIATIYEDRAGVIWAGTRNGLSRFDRSTAEWTSYFTTFADGGTATNALILAIAEDDQGALWFGIYDRGLYRFDPQTGQSTVYAHDPANPVSLGDDKVYGVAYDRRGVLWIGMRSGGLNRLDPATGQFSRYQHDPLGASSLGQGPVLDLYEDRAGSLWISIDGWGLSVYHPARTPFRHYTDSPLASESLSDASVRPIYQDHVGVIWIGTAAGGLNRLDPRTRRMIHYRNDPADPHSLSDNGVYALTEDRAGALWVGTFGGLNRFDPATQQFTRYLHEPHDPASLSHNFVYAVTEDGDGNLWIGTDRGLNRFDPATGRFQRFLHDPDRADSLSHDRIFAIMADRERELWVGTNWGGLNRFNPETGGWIHYRHSPEAPTSLSHDTVYALHEDRAGQVWVGTLNGLNRLDRATGQCVRYTQHNGLPSDTITGILEDDQGDLWLSTVNGLARFDPRTATAHVFDQSDGLLNRGYDFFSAYRTRQGELWFGGKKGLDVIDPTRIIENSFVPPVVLTGFEINNLPVLIGGSSALRRSITSTDALTLSYRDRVMTFEFAALNFIAPQKNRYQYMLEGFDREWIVTSSDRRRVTYTNLDAGHYVFRVRGSNNDGVWNEEGVSLGITITPPWWETWWWYTLCVLGVLGVFGLVYWNQATQLRTERALRESEARFTMLFRSISDAVILTDLQRRIIAVNPAVTSIFGYQPEELIGHTTECLYVDNASYEAQGRIRYHVGADMPSQLFETTYRRKDGTMVACESLGTTITDVHNHELGFVGIHRDITKRKRTEERLKTSLTEKDVLLRELYHRTKNTLQVIRSMLMLQAARMPENAPVQKLVNDTERRIMAMALVHQKLYQSQDLSRIPMQDYIGELAHLIMQSQVSDDQPITLRIEVDNLSLLLDTAIPCGLILTELLSNALKYAFPDDRQGEIVIRLRTKNPESVELCVADTGIGVPPGFDFREQETLGIQTIIAIAEHQMQGQVQFASERGLTCTVAFPTTLYSERV